MKPSFFLKTFLPVFAAIILVAGIAYSVWTEPTAAPPGNNVEAPINTGATAQTKAGAMYSNDRVGAPNLCIGTDCRSVWPAERTPSYGCVCYTYVGPWAPGFATYINCGGGYWLITSYFAAAGTWARGPVYFPCSP